jgi:hypothetical protein
MQFGAIKEWRANIVAASVLLNSAIRRGLVEVIRLNSAMS